MHPTPKQLDMSERSQRNLFFYAPQSTIHTTTSHLGCCRSPRWAVTPPDLWAYEAITTSKAQSLPNSVMPPLGLQARVTETKLTIKLFPTKKIKKTIKILFERKKKKKKARRVLHALFYCKRKKEKKVPGQTLDPTGRGSLINSVIPSVHFSHTLLLSFLFIFTPKRSPQSWILNLLLLKSNFCFCL